MKHPNVRKQKRRGRRIHFLRFVVLALLLVCLIAFSTRSAQNSEDVLSSELVSESEPVSDSEPSSVITPEPEPDSDAAEESPELPIAEKLEAILSDNDGLYPERMKELAQNNEELIDYVYRYPQYVLQEPQAINLSRQAWQDSVPLLIQWDSRWGYETYGDGLMGYTGCGPTCLAMVALYLTHDETVTPISVANWAEESGYYVHDTGTSWKLMITGCQHFGIQSTEIPLVEGSIQKALEQGEPIICCVGPGDFTTSGHFLVITGYTEDGYRINDPNSSLRSSQLWSYDTLASQIRVLWAYSPLADSSAENKV